jgi:hypothetical protein
MIASSYTYRDSLPLRNARRWHKRDYHSFMTNGFARRLLIGGAYKYGTTVSAL